MNTGVKGVRVNIYFRCFKKHADLEKHLLTRTPFTPVKYPNREAQGSPASVDDAAWNLGE